MALPSKREYGPMPARPTDTTRDVYHIASLGLTTRRTVEQREDGWYAVWTEGTP